MNKLVTLLLFIMVILFFACNNDSKTGEKTASISGEQLFKINCAQCHKPTEDFTGPALKNAVARWKNKNTLYEFIKDPRSVIARNEYAKNIFEKWQQAYMQPFPQLTNDEIDNILSYCQTAE